jgi:hypothetical protein
VQDALLWMVGRGDLDIAAVSDRCPGSTERDARLALRDLLRDGLIVMFDGRLVLTEHGERRSQQ